MARATSTSAYQVSVEFSLGTVTDVIMNYHDYILPDGSIEPFDKKWYRLSNSIKIQERLGKEIKWPSPQASLKFKLLISKNLTLLSGRTIGEINGDSTCLKYNGNSVINYIGVSAYSFTG